MRFRKGDRVKCLQCSEHFTVRRPYKPNKFCSDACTRASRAVNQTARCLGCNAEIRVTYRRHKPKYCSKECITKYADEQRLNRLLSRVDIKDADECWEWTGPVNGSGYGYFTWSRSVGSQRTHRAMYMLWHRTEIEDGLLVCHSCDNRRCVNPNHLWLGTHRDNIHDCHTKKRGRWWQRSQAS